MVLRRLSAYLKFCGVDKGSIVEPVMVRQSRADLSAQVGVGFMHPPEVRVHLHLKLAEAVKFGSSPTAPQAIGYSHAALKS